MTEIIQADADQITITEPPCRRCGHPDSDHRTRPQPAGSPDQFRRPCNCGECPDIINELDTRSAVIVMDGERCECNGGLHEQGRCAAAWPVMPGEATYPPEQVRRLTEPCETCKGRGYVGHDSLMTSTTWKACPHCYDGKPTFTLHQRVIEPHKYTEKSARARLQRRRENDDELFMIEMDGDWYTGRFIDLGDGWVITDVLPITERNDRSETRLVFLNEVGNAYLYDPTNTINVPLDMPSAARPGQYAIIAEQAGR